MFRRLQAIAVGLLITLVAAAGVAQPPSRRAANLAALASFPGFYHGRSVIIVGSVSRQDNGQLRVSDEGTSLPILFKGAAPDGLAEIHAEFWDVGRMKPDDPRLTATDLRSMFHLDADGQWPRPGEITALVAASITAASVPPAPTIRAIVLHPTRYVNQQVTVTGQFAGRNLSADLPDAPARSRWDFVIHTSDAAMWVSGARPKGKGFDLALDARIDTGRWLEVTGVIHEARGLQWIDVKDDAIQLGKAPTETPTPIESLAVRVPSAPPPEVVFSAPTQGESDVALTGSVRIQFSRDLDPSTLKGHVRAGYLESQTVEKGEPTTPSATFSTQYNAANRVLELKFGKPLERFRTLKVELLDGILGTDQQPLKPWTLTFDLGGA